FISVLIFGILAFLWNNPIALTSVLFLETIDIAFFYSASRSFFAESIEDAGLKDFLGTAFSLAVTFSMISTSLGSLIGGFLINVLGYTKTFIIFLIMSIISLTMRLFYRETLKRRETSIQVRNPLQSIKHLREIVGFKGISLIVVYVLIVSLISNISNIYIPIFMEKILKMNKMLIGLSYCLMDILSAVVQPVAGKFVDKFGPLLGIMMMHIIAAPMVIAFVNSVNPFYAIIFISISSSASTFYYAGYPTLITKITKSEIRSTVYGVLTSVMKIGAIPGPILGALLWSFNPKMTFYATALLDVLAIIILILLRAEVGSI
ncbi:MAG: MFS transporter, partial [Crenarchaeota archaeon]|nr:MFS transporter [Thermoproteota archaeon]